jgi:hypothetical protein
MLLRLDCCFLLWMSYTARHVVFPVQMVMVLREVRATHAPRHSGIQAGGFGSCHIGC